MLFLIIAIGICVIDQIMKFYVECVWKKEEVPEDSDSKVMLTKQYNTGFILNWCERQKNTVKFISLILCSFLFGVLFTVVRGKGENFLKVALSFLFGGALSNTIDRVKKGHVVDYLKFRKIKNIIFNIADLFIFLGAIMIAIREIFHKK